MSRPLTFNFSIVTWTQRAHLLLPVSESIFILLCFCSIVCGIACRRWYMSSVQHLIPAWSAVSTGIGSSHVISRPSSTVPQALLPASFDECMSIITTALCSFVLLQSVTASVQIRQLMLYALLSFLLLILLIMVKFSLTILCFRHIPYDVRQFLAICCLNVVDQPNLFLGCSYLIRSYSDERCIEAFWMKISTNANSILDWKIEDYVQC